MSRPEPAKYSGQCASCGKAICNCTCNKVSPELAKQFNDAQPEQEPVPAPSWRDAIGASPSQPGDKLSEHYIRKVRGEDTPKCHKCGRLLKPTWDADLYISCDCVPGNESGAAALLAKIDALKNHQMAFADQRNFANALRSILEKAKNHT